MSNTTQYTYGVIGASESSTTSAIDLVPAGAPAQVSGGEPELVLELRRRHREADAVEIIDQDADAEQNADAPAQPGNAGGGSFGQGHGISSGDSAPID